jgi:hypothetical protein
LGEALQQLLNLMLYRCRCRLELGEQRQALPPYSGTPQRSTFQLAIMKRVQVRATHFLGSERAVSARRSGRWLPASLGLYPTLAWRHACPPAPQPSNRRAPNTSFLAALEEGSGKDHVVFLILNTHRQVGGVWQTNEALHRALREL